MDDQTTSTITEDDEKSSTNPGDKVGMKGRQESPDLREEEGQLEVLLPRIANQDTIRLATSG
jgi:hypothetical protein